MVKVQEMITERRWKRVSSIATAGALERKRGIPACSSTQPAGCYQVWAAHITQAIRASSKSMIKKLPWTSRKNRLQQGGMHISHKNYSALIWSQEKNSPKWSGFVLIQRSLS